MATRNKRVYSDGEKKARKKVRCCCNSTTHLTRAFRAQSVREVVCRRAARGGFVVTGRSSLFLRGATNSFPPRPLKPESIISPRRLKTPTRFASASTPRTRQSGASPRKTGQWHQPFRQGVELLPWPWAPTYPWPSRHLEQREGPQRRPHRRRISLRPLRPPFALSLALAAFPEVVLYVGGVVWFPLLFMFPNIGSLSGMRDHARA